MNAVEYVLAGGLAVGGPDRPAIVTADECLTYGDLAARVGRFAAALREAGIAPGDRVAILMLDHADLVALYLAVMAAGSVAVTVSTRASAHDLAHVFGIVRPFVVVTEEEFSEPAAASVPPNAKLLLRQRELAAWKQRTETDFVACARTPDDPAYWVMTSGTTGKPKAVEHRHHNVRACTDYLVHGLAATADDRLFATSRLNFAYALGATFGALRLGATVILHERWPTPATIASTVELQQPSIVLSVPTLFHKLVESGLAQKPAFSKVRCYVSAGERLPPRIGADWEKTTSQPIVDAMSCSELVHKIFSNTVTSRRAGSSGRPVPGVEVRLIDADGVEVKGPGRSGRLQVRAPFLCAGYRLADAPPHAAAHRPAERFHGDWFATGDEYVRDEDGFYYHCGRSDDMLKVSGLWVSPSEIEDALAGIASIAEVAAVSGESAAGLSEIVLYVVPAPGADGEVALATARDQLARCLPPFKLPRQYALVPELPRTATGKVRRHVLRDDAGLAPHFAPVSKVSRAG
jgi:acyl-coenzyme A synthetase/AMP-(fatty) acid ligase